MRLEVADEQTFGRRSFITANDLVARSAQIGAQLHERAQELLELPLVGVSWRQRESVGGS